MAKITDKQIEVVSKYRFNKTKSSTAISTNLQRNNNNRSHSLQEQICALCGTPANLRCSGCKSTWYCSIEHQHKDWYNRHAKECDSKLSESSNTNYNNKIKSNCRPKKRGFFANINQTKHTKQNNMNDDEYPPAKKRRLIKLENQESIILKNKNIQLQKQNIDLKQNIHEYNQKYNVMNTKYNDLMECYKINLSKVDRQSKTVIKLQRENIDYSKQLESNKELIVNKHKLQINVANVDVLELNELIELETHMEKGLIGVREIKNKFIENKYLCIICCKNERNISFSSCQHIVLCTECEKKLETKRCPICQQQYFFVDKLQF